MATESLPEVAVVASRLLPLAAITALAASTRADTGDAEILGDHGWRVEDVELRTSYLAQRGRGYQSQAGERGEPGSQEMWLVAPAARITLRQSDAVVHEVTLPVDVVSAASPDAVDATTSASRHNEAIALDVRSAIRRSEVDTITTRVAIHNEEHWRSATLGMGWRRGLADDNAAIALTGNVTGDYFRGLDHLGNIHDSETRATLNANLSAFQLLSPTTVVDGSYGITHQRGELSNGWNAVPVGPYRPYRELMPDRRTRHALAGRIAQHVPATRSTLKLWYRFYVDDFDLDAHTVRLDAYQWLGASLYVRGGYRFHRQEAVAFFTTSFDPGSPIRYRTADSDLAAFDAHEWSVQLVSWFSRWRVTAELLHYTRDNDLVLTAVSFGAGRAL